MLAVSFFPSSETRCRCNCGWDILPTFRAKLDEIRIAYGHPISLNSGARCLKHNAALIPPGAKKSAHIDGCAADLTYTPELLAYIEANLEKHNIWMEHPSVTGTSRIHIDTRNRGNKNRKFFP